MFCKFYTYELVMEISKPNQLFLHNEDHLSLETDWFWPLFDKIL